MIYRILNSSPKYDIIRNNNHHKQISFKGIKPMENDKFTLSTNKPFLLHEFEVGEYEGYVTFGLEGKKDTRLSARFDIITPNDVPDIKRNDLFDGDFRINLVEDVEKVSSNTKTYLHQPGPNKYLTPTKFIARITEQLNNKNFMAQIEEFPKAVLLLLEDVADLKIGDKIKASGLLECKFK